MYHWIMDHWMMMIRGGELRRQNGEFIPSFVPKSSLARFWRRTHILYAHRHTHTCHKPMLNTDSQPQFNRPASSRDYSAIHFHPRPHSLCFPLVCWELNSFPRSLHSVSSPIQCNPPRHCNFQKKNWLYLRMKCSTHTQCVCVFINLFVADP